MVAKVTALNKGPNKSGFVFEDEKGNAPNTVLGILPLKTFLTQYTDSSGKRCARIVFKIPGDTGAHILREQIQGAFVVSTASKWFVNSFNEKLVELEGGSEDAVEEI